MGEGRGAAAVKSPRDGGGERGREEPLSDMGANTTESCGVGGVLREASPHGWFGVVAAAALLRAPARRVGPTSPEEEIQQEDEIVGELLCFVNPRYTPVLERGWRALSCHRQHNGI